MGKNITVNNVQFETNRQMLEKKYLKNSKLYIDKLNI